MNNRKTSTETELGYVRPKQWYTSFGPRYEDGILHPSIFFPFFSLYTLLIIFYRLVHTDTTIDTTIDTTTNTTAKRTNNGVDGKTTSSTETKLGYIRTSFDDRHEPAPPIASVWQARAHHCQTETSGKETNTIRDARTTTHVAIKELEMQPGIFFFFFSSFLTLLTIVIYN